MTTLLLWPLYFYGHSTFMTTISQYKNIFQQYNKTPPYDHLEITTTLLLRPLFLSTKIFSNNNSMVIFLKLQPPRYSTNMTSH